jgi:hypothetical protein
MSALQANSPAAKWLKGLARVTAGGAARRMREAARLKALQRTPYPMVLARIKLLLDRLQVCCGGLQYGFIMYGLQYGSNSVMAGRG